MILIGIGANLESPVYGEPRATWGAALAALAPVKGWWARSFADEVLETLRPGDEPPTEPSRRSSRRKRASSGG